MTSNNKTAFNSVKITKIVHSKWQTIIFILLVSLLEFTLCKNCSNLTIFNDTCISCVASSQKCTYCITGMGVNSLGMCESCTYPCLECSLNVSMCTKCTMQYVINGSSCSPNPCRDPNSYIDITNGMWIVNNGTLCDISPDFCEYSYCIQCSYGYGPSTFPYQQTTVCQPCKVPNCMICANTSCTCSQCFPYYGLNLNGICQSCDTNNCAICGSNYLICTYCQNMFGLSGGSCEPCQSPCVICIGSSSTNCTSCSGQYILSVNESMCIICTPNCSICNSTNCLQCDSGYYPNGQMCIQCQQYCLTCLYNETLSSQACSQCSMPEYFYLKNYTTKLKPAHCKQRCGDKFVFVLPCDLGKGIYYDGCLDNCHVEDGFDCENVTNISINTSLCSYQEVLEMNIIYCERFPFQNCLIMKIDIWPPLYVFTDSDITKVFFIVHQNLTLMNLTYDNWTHTITLFANFNGDITDTPIVFEFIPNQTVDSRYWKSQNSSANISVEYYFYSPTATAITKMLPYFCYTIVGFGLCSLLVGLFLNRLGGLESMITLQLGFLSIVWLNQLQVMQAFLQVYPLKYVLGYSISIKSETSKLRMLDENYGFLYAQPQKYPYVHLNAFSMNESILVNSFNLMMLFQLIPSIIYITLYYRIMMIDRKKNALMTNKQYQKANNQIKQERNILNKHKEKLRSYKILALKWFMYWSVFNLIGFTFHVFLFFQLGYQGNHISDFVFLSVMVALYLLIIVNFLHNPTDFGPFWYTFKPQFLSLYRYNFYVIAIISTVFFLYFQPQHSWTSMIPFSIFLLYTIIKRPHKEHLENFRTIFNTLVILSCFGIRIFIQYYGKQNSANQQKINLFHFINIILLFLVVIIALISIIVSVWVTYKNESNVVPDEHAKQKEAVLIELSNTNVRKKMNKTDDEGSILKKLINPKINMFQFFEN